MTAGRSALPSRSGSTSAPLALLSRGRGRPLLAVVTTLSIVGGTLAFLQGGEEADAFVAPPVPVIPVPAAGSVTLGGTSTTTGVAAAAGGSGAAILAVPAVAVAGFAAGYYGMKGLCTGFAIYGGVCPPYEPNLTPSVGAVTSGRFGCNHTSSYGQLIIGECVQYSWQTLADLGVGEGAPIPQAAFYYDKSGEPLGLPTGGCVGLPGSLPIGYQYLRAYHWAGSLGCGEPDSTSLLPPPYTGGYVRARVANIGVQDGQRNGTLEPGDRVRIHHCANTPTSIGFGYPTPYNYGHDCNPSPVAEVPADPTVDARGFEFRYVVTAQCWSAMFGGSAQYSTRNSVGLWGFQNAPPAVPPSPCLPGEVPTGLNLDWEVYKRSSYYSGPAKLTTLGLERVNIIQWQAPAEVTTDPNIRECYTVGSSPCTLEQLDQADPETCRWGGESVPASYCGQTQLQLVDNPTGTTQPTPTTLPQSTTTIPPPTTTIPGPPGPDDPEPPTPPEPDPEGAFDFGTCMGEQTAGIAVGWDPLSWVPALVRYMVAPIICSILWLVVPSDGFAAVFEDLSRSLTESELVGPFVGAVTSLQLSQCAPVTLPAVGQMQGRTIDVGLCGNVVVNGVWSMFFMLGLLGLGKEAIDTVTQFRRNQIARSLQAQG